MPAYFPACEMPGCTDPLFSLVWIEGLHVHALCMEHAQDFIDGAVIEGVSLRCMPLNVESHRN